MRGTHLKKFISCFLVTAPFLALHFALGLLPTVALANDIADTQPALQTAPARIAAAIGKLGDRDPDVRDIAQADLEEAADAALPLLEEARKSDDPEIQRRARLAIIAITAPRLPTLVTLDANDMTVPALLDELSRTSGQPIHLGVRDPDRLEKIKLSLHVKDEPFWAVLLKICQPADLQPTGIALDGPVLRLGDGYGAWDHRFVSIHGPFAMSLALMNRTSQVLYGKAPQRTSEATINVYLQTEAQSHPLACRNLTVTRCQDADGKPVKVTGGASQPFNGATVIGGGLRFTPAPAHIAVIDGTVDYILEGRRLTLVVLDILKANNVPRRLGNIGLTIRECEKVGDRTWAIRVAMSRDGRADEAWNELKVRIRDTHPHLEDASGVQIPPWPYPQPKETPDGCEIEYRLSVPTANAQNAVPVGDPVKLVWDIPTRQRLVTVPFHFEDIPLP